MRSFVRVSRKSIVAVSVTAVLGAVPSAALATTGGASAPRTPTASQPSGDVLNTASPEHENVLTAVAARPSGTAWAVGWWSTASGPNSLIERWNGKAWKIAPSPNPARGVGSDPELEGVAATSSSNAWAVGGYGNDAQEQTLIYHWNGRSWKQVQSPDPAGHKGDQMLLGVAASSASRTWAVGVAGLKPLIERWNGRAWRTVASPLPRHGTRGALNAVVALSSSNAWAVGEYVKGTVDLPLTEHWNGKTWKVVSTAGRFRDGGFLTGVTATSASSVWTVGQSDAGPEGTSQLLMERWNGHRWNMVPIANPPGATLGANFFQVAAASPKDVWAVGEYGDEATGPTGSVPLFEHWNGKAWKQIPAPDGGTFNSVAVVSATSAWAVGIGLTGQFGQTLTAHWNGKAWTQVPSPDK